MKAKTFLSFLLLGTFTLLCAGLAQASEGTESHGLPWGNFLLRITNVAIVLGIIWYFAGGMIKRFLVGRADKVVHDLDELDRLKKEAALHLVDVEKRVANLEEECVRLLADGKAQAEQLAASLIEEAEHQADLIINQAHRSAEQEARAEMEALRAKIADEIIISVQKTLPSKLTSEIHHKLIDKSITQVAGF